MATPLSTAGPCQQRQDSMSTHGLAVAAVLLLLLGCAAAQPGSGLHASARSCSATPGCSVVISEANLAACLIDYYGNDLPKRVVGPESGPAQYDAARTMAFGRRALPRVVVYAYKTEDVVAAVKCAAAYGFSVSAAGRRHSYQGWSVLSGSVTIDVSNITNIAIDKSALTADVGAGNTNGLLLAAVARANVPGLMSVIGSCPSVGVTGYVLGGGQGDITPYVGLGADQVLAVTMVLWNGTVITADKDKHADVLWATKGGGGGLGVITQLKLKLHIAPDKRHFTWIGLMYKREARVEVAKRFSDWLASPAADARLGGSGGIGPQFAGFQLVYLGTWQEAVKVLRSAGLLNKDWLLQQLLSTLSVNFTAQPWPADLPAGGVTLYEYNNYGHVEAQMICRFVEDYPGVRKAVGLPGSGPLRCNSSQEINALLQEMGKPASDLNVGTSPLWSSVLANWVSTGGFLMRSLPKTCWQAILQVFEPSATLTGGNSSAPTRQAPLPQQALIDAVAATESFTFAHLCHGAVGKVAPNATAYRWRGRNLLATVDSAAMPGEVWAAAIAATPACAGGKDPAKDLGCGVAGTAAIVDAKNAIAQRIKSVLAACPEPSASDAGYYNYLPAAKQGWQRFFWGPNYERLATIKGEYDPVGLFDKPYTPQRPTPPLA